MRSIQINAFPCVYDMMHGAVSSYVGSIAILARLFAIFVGDLKSSGVDENDHIGLLYILIGSISHKRKNV